VHNHVQIGTRPEPASCLVAKSGYFLHGIKWPEHAGYVELYLPFTYVQFLGTGKKLLLHLSDGLYSSPMHQLLYATEVLVSSRRELPETGPQLKSFNVYFISNRWNDN
jgi:hypothetical protein